MMYTAIVILCLAIGLMLGLLEKARKDRKFWMTRAEEKAQENRLLREAIRDANAELRRHRAVLADITNRESREAVLARIDEGKADAAG